MREIETIEKVGNIKDFYGIKGARSYRDLLLRLIRKYKGMNTKYGDTKDLELAGYTEGLLKEYNKYHTEVNAQVEVEGWQGTSSFELIKGLNKLTIIKYKRKDKDTEPDKITIEVFKEEQNTLIESIKRLCNEGTIDTRYLARAYCNVLGIVETDGGKNLYEGNFWDNFFSWRRMHNKFTLMLGALDKLGFIKYVGGKTTLLNNTFSVQTILQ